MPTQKIIVYGGPDGFRYLGPVTDIEDIDSDEIAARIPGHHWWIMDLDPYDEPSHEVDSTPVSPEMLRFFEGEIRNDDDMRHESEYRGRRHDIPPASTLGSAADSLCQAPSYVIAQWFFGANLLDRSPVPHLLELGTLLERYGHDQPLDTFYKEDT